MFCKNCKKNSICCCKICGGIILIAIIIGAFYLFNYLQTPKPIYVITEDNGQVTVNPGGGEVPSGPPIITPPTYLPPEN